MCVGPLYRMHEPHWYIPKKFFYLVTHQNRSHEFVLEVGKRRYEAYHVLR